MLDRLEARLQDEKGKRGPGWLTEALAHQREEEKRSVIAEQPSSWACPNHCGATLDAESAEEHFAEDCPLQVRIVGPGLSQPHRPLRVV